MKVGAGWKVEELEGVGLLGGVGSIMKRPEAAPGIGVDHRALVVVSTHIDEVDGNYHDGVPVEPTGITAEYSKACID